MIKTEQYSVIILAAGHSVRMGSPKALLVWKDKKYSFLEKIIDEYLNAGIANIIVVVQDTLASTLNSNYPAIVEKSILIINYQPDMGRLFSIWLGLSNVKPNQNIFIQNVDNPFINSQFIRDMIRRKPTKGYLKPVYENHGGHPVLLSKEIVPQLFKVIFNFDDFKSSLQQFRLKTFYHNLPLIHTNINTPDDYNKLIKNHF
jgi:molybdenum cofactor cytidylyltransferase